MKEPVMICSDLILIDSDGTALERAYAEAVRAVNEGRHQRLLARPLAQPGYGAFRSRRDASREGLEQWAVFYEHLPSFEVVVWTAWWTDVLGRKHHRIVAERDPRQWVSWDKVPPLALLYPERTVRRTCGEREAVVVACDCGAAGKPNELAWMGDRCGPCHDRHEEGSPPTQPAWAAPLPETCQKIAWTEHGPKLALVPWDTDRVRLWDVSLGTELPPLVPGHAVGAVGWSPAGNLLALLDAGQQAVEGTTVALWDVEQRELRHAWEPHTGLLSTLTFSPDGARLATANRDEGFRVFAVPGGQLVFAQSGYSGRGQGLSFAPDGVLLAVVSDSHTVAFWDLPQRRVRAVLQVEPRTPALAFAPDGITLAVWTDWPEGEDRGGEVWLWDFPAGKERACLRGHKGAVRQVLFGPDGGTVVTWGADRTLRLWAADTSAELGRLEWFDRPPCLVAATTAGVRTVHLGGPCPVLTWPLALFAAR
jgi:hypothetical protein